MKRVLIIAIPLYFLLPAVGVLAFKLDFQPGRIAGTPLFIISILWLANGLAAMTAGIVIAGRTARGAYSPGPAPNVVLALAGVALGIPPAYIIVELLYKLALFLQWL